MFAAHLRIRRAPASRHLMLYGAASIAVAVGCSRQESRAPESLPWSNAAEVEQAEAKNRSAATGEIPETKGPIDESEGERGFRNHLVKRNIAHLRQIAADPIVVNAVMSANRTNQQTQKDIDLADKHWRETEGVDDPQIGKYLNNSCAVYLKKMQGERPQYVELFVIDAKGCIVAESNKTSDYWQGDEAKWLESFHDGQGKLFVDDIGYDESTHSYVVQVSLPVMHDGATIGAITISLASPPPR